MPQISATTLSALTNVELAPTRSDVRILELTSDLGDARWKHVAVFLSRDDQIRLHALLGAALGREPDPTTCALCHEAFSPDDDLAAFYDREDVRFHGRCLDEHGTDVARAIADIPIPNSQLQPIRRTVER